MDINKLSEKLEIAKEELKTLEVIEVPQEEQKELLTEDVLIDANLLSKKQMIQDDFMEVRNSLKNLVKRGEDIINQIQFVDVADLKSSQIQAVASLQSAIGSNLKLLLDLHKQLIDTNNSLEYKKDKKEDSNVKIQQNNLFVGTSRDLLLEMIKSTQNNND